jgi:hypothetical protein
MAMMKRFTIMPVEDPRREVADGKALHYRSFQRIRALADDEAPNYRSIQQIRALAHDEAIHHRQSRAAPPNPCR